MNRPYQLKPEYLKWKLSFLICICFSFGAIAQTKVQSIQPCSWMLDEYLPVLKGRSVGIFANQTSLVGNKHLVDTLIALKVNITKIFAPEHGFRGESDAGEDIDNQTDARTGIPIISLYG